jgi:poly(A) polymerase
MSARGSGAVAAPEMIAAHLELVREVLPTALEWQREGPPDPPIRGDELARELGIEEGPALGDLLEELRAAVFAREVASRDDAVDHARRTLAAASE